MFLAHAGVKGVNVWFHKHPLSVRWHAITLAVCREGGVQREACRGGGGGGGGGGAYVQFLISIINT